MKKIALIFPGQGINLDPVKTLIGENKTAVDVFKKAGEATGRDLIQALDNDNSIPDQALIVTSCVAYFEALIRGKGLLPSISFMAGHSLGEYSALICSGALSLSKGLPLIEQRQRIMDTCASEAGGGMAALRCPDKNLMLQYLEEIQEKTNDIWISAYNSPGQIVVSGKQESLNILLQNNKHSELIISQLPINGPLHCPLMTPAANDFQDLLDSMVYDDFQCAVFSSVSGNIYEGKHRINENLSGQLTKAVIWEPLVHKLIGKQVGLIINVGPSRVLTNMMNQFQLSVECINLTTSGEIETCKSYLQDQLGKYLSPISHCLANAVGMSVSMHPDEEILEVLESDYDQIKEIWNDNILHNKQATPDQISESFGLLRKIFQAKGLSQKNITQRIEQLNYQTGNRCLN